MGVAVSSSHFVSAAPSSSGEGLLPLFPCSSMKSLSWERVLHKLLQRESFPLVAVLHKAAPWGHKCCSQTCSSMGSSLSTEPKVLPGACSSMDFPQGHSLLQASTCSSMGSFMDLGGDLLHRGPPWAAGTPPVSPWSSLQAAGEKSLLRSLEHLLPLLVH